jgi:YtoQ family protein
MELKVYLSGEIHTDWREQIIQGCQKADLNIVFYSAVTDHEASDGAADILGAETQSGQKHPLSVVI